MKSGKRGTLTVEREKNPHSREVETLTVERGTLTEEREEPSQ